MPTRDAQEILPERDPLSWSESQQSVVTRIGTITEDAQFEESEGWTPSAFSPLQDCVCNVKAMGSLPAVNELQAARAE